MGHRHDKKMNDPEVDRVMELRRIKTWDAAARRRIATVVGQSAQAQEAEALLRRQAKRERTKLRRMGRSLKWNMRAGRRR